MIVLDASGLYSFIDASQPQHEAAERTLEAETPPFVLSPFVLAEVDHLILRDVDVRAESALLKDVASETYELASFGTADVAAALEIIDRYRDLRIGLADASIVVLAERYETNRVLTLDERHFRALKLKRGRPFVVLPADA